MKARGLKPAGLFLYLPARSEPMNNDLRARRADLIRTHGPWTAHSIHLGDGVYTDDDPVRRASNADALRRFTQITADLAGRPIHELRVLDLGCLEGQYGIELALQGAEVVGVDVREEHLAKARFAAERLGLRRYDVRCDDIRNLHPDSYGVFDVVLCIGILYHLDAPDVFDVIRRMAAVCSRLLLVDTHVSDWRGKRLSYDGRGYRGRKKFEHLPWS